MTNPGPPGGDERPLAGPETGMGLPESGTQHATSTDFALPVDRFADPAPDPLSSGGTSTAEVSSTPPPAQPASPLYDELVTPAVVEVHEVVETDQPTAASGVLAKVKAFAAQRPEAFLGATLVAGLLVGRLLSSSDDDEES
jgi:hypothetical protein